MPAQEGGGGLLPNRLNKCKTRRGVRCCHRNIKCFNTCVATDNPVPTRPNNGNIDLDLRQWKAQGILEPSSKENPKGASPQPRPPPTKPKTPMSDNAFKEAKNRMGAGALLPGFLLAGGLVGGMRIPAKKNDLEERIHRLWKEVRFVR